MYMAGGFCVFWNAAFQIAKSGPLAPSSVAELGSSKQGPVEEAGVDAGRVLHDLTLSRPRPLSTEAQDWWPGDIARSYPHYSANSPFEYVRNGLLTRSALHVRGRP
jgi:hypothetical protein